MDKYISCVDAGKVEPKLIKANHMLEFWKLRDPPGLLANPELTLDGANNLVKGSQLGTFCP